MNSTGNEQMRIFIVHLDQSIEVYKRKGERLSSDSSKSFRLKASWGDSQRIGRTVWLRSGTNQG
jgi:hypothetical protein